MTLTFELDLDPVKHDLRAKIQDCMYVRSARIVRQTMPKLLHPPLTQGVNIGTPGNARARESRETPPGTKITTVCLFAF